MSLHFVVISNIPKKAVRQALINVYNMHTLLAHMYLPKILCEMREMVRFLHEIPNMCDFTNVLLFYLSTLILQNGLVLTTHVLKWPTLGKSFKLRLKQTEYVLRIIV
jgi:hypothetical protein